MPHNGTGSRRLMTPKSNFWVSDQPELSPSHRRVTLKGRFIDDYLLGDKPNSVQTNGAVTEATAENANRFQLRH